MIKKGKKNTPDFILDIRNGKYSWDEAVSVILFHAGIEKHPVDVLHVANYLGFSVYDNVHFDENDISGKMYDCSSPIQVNGKDEKRVILLSDKINSTEEKLFTIAHEIAHFALHVNDDYDFFEAKHFPDKESMSKNDLYRKAFEDTADKFAAMILMPTETFVNRFNNLRDKNMQIDEIVEKLKKMFLVSEQGVLKRISELSLWMV